MGICLCNRGLLLVSYMPGLTAAGVILGGIITGALKSRMIFDRAGASITAHIHRKPNPAVWVGFFPEKLGAHRVHGAAGRGDQTLGYTRRNQKRRLYSGGNRPYLLQPDIMAGLAQSIENTLKISGNLQHGENTRRHWILLGQWRTASPRIRTAIAAADRVVSVDGGSRMLAALNITPHLAVGDMDSTPPELLTRYRQAGVPLHLHPVRKDATDLELALDLALDADAAAITILGATGGRLDHTLETCCS